VTTIQIPTKTIPLKRLDNCTWSYQPLPEERPKQLDIDEIRIQTPAISIPGQAYELAQLVAYTLKINGFFSEVHSGQDLFLDIQRHTGSLNGKWRVTLESDQGLTSKLFQWIPFIKIYPPHHYVKVSAERAEKEFSPSFIHKIKDFVFSRQIIPVDGQITRAMISSLPARMLPFSDRLKQLAYDDPFTRLAAKALQTVETEFVSERAVQGSCRLVLDLENQLSVQLISVGDNIEENRRTVRKYKEFLLDEYGPDHAAYAQFAYGFNFDDMIEKGLPLLPDHVFKMNVGVNNIEMAHIENLYRKLHQLRLDLALHSSKGSLQDLLEYYHAHETGVRFSIRELRHLLAIAGKEVVDGYTLKAFLDRWLGNMIPDSIQHLMPEQLNALIAMIWPSNEDLARALTGRQITHLAICGYKTMGNPNQSDPSRDQAELLQIFSDLQKTEDWDNFYELLAHVAVKKNLFREYPDGEKSVWRTGIIIPAPKTKEGESRWFYVAKVRDDGEGNLNYILLPAVKSYRIDGRPMPMIHLYRSTNSDRNAIDSIGSIENDLNPQGAPGSLGEDTSKGMKGGYFFNRTIPLWVAFLLDGENQLPEKQSPSYRQALDELERMLDESEYPDHAKLEKIANLRAADNPAEMRAFLFAEAEARRELPKFKRSQDIVFVGHSLGGALAQYGANYFAPGSRRIPCPGCNLICRSYNGPATNSSIDRGFMQFGRTYRELIKGLGQHWKIFHQFEYGDFVPEAGESHLGTEEYHPEYDQDWLDVHIQIFRPLEGAHALPITTCPTHGRRIGQAVPNFDYQLNTLTASQLSEYDHSWMLSGDVKQLFGYRILISPLITEILRRAIGAVSVPLIHAGSSIYGYFKPERVQRNYEGVFSCEYKAASMQPAVWLNSRV
jgi:hypothetical protein